MKFASRCLEVVWHIGLNEHIESSSRANIKSVLGLLQNIFGLLKVVADNIYFSNMIFHLTFIKVWLIIQNNKHCKWIKIEESPKCKFFDNIEDLSIRSFWYHSKWHQDEALGYVVLKLHHVRGTLWLCCVHIAQLMTHLVGYTSPFTL